jgi:uncharacterized membrane protein
VTLYSEEKIQVLFFVISIFAPQFLSNSWKLHITRKWEYKGL